MKRTRTSMWNAIAERSREADGQFVFAVKTTGIYCRPSCPSRRPKEENVEFFDTAESARQSGFRACARCRPDADRSNSEMIVEKARKYIEENLDRSITLLDIGTAVGVSQFHLQRVFKTECGVSPRQYVENCRLVALKGQLRSGRQVTEAMYEAGYSSSSRLYERSNSQLGMTPGAYAKRGKGELINCAYIHSPLGILLMAGTSKGLCFLQFGETEESLMTALKSEFSAAGIVENADALSDWIEQLTRYLSGQTSDLDLPVDLRGTELQQAVWRYLRQIPPGQTRTYTEVATAVGKPNAIRAVASACAANRIAIAIPCHRVVRQGGELAGYRWGLERKKALLQQERQD